MKRLAWTAGGLMLLAGTALAQNQTRTTTETQKQDSKTYQRQEKTTLPSQPSETTTPQDTNTKQDKTDLGATRDTTGNQLDKSKVSGREVTQNADEPKKSLTAVELYTKSALDNAKVAYEAAQLPQGPMDKQMFKEISTNISRDIQNAQKHLGHFQSMAKAETGKPDVAAKREDVLNQLKDAKQANAKLMSSVSKDRSMLRDQAAMVFTSLKAANDSLKDIEDAYDVTSIDKIMPSEKAPVRGTEMDHGKTKGTPTGEPSKSPEEMNQAPSQGMQPPATTTPAPDKTKKSMQPNKPNDY